jgi:hypothetical protein
MGMERSATYSSLALLCFAACYLLSLLYSSDTGIMAVRNVSGLLLDYIALHSGTLQRNKKVSVQAAR